MKTRLFLSMIILGWLPLAASAQTTDDKKFGFELNGGTSVATRQISQASTVAGAGFEALFHYHPAISPVGLYAGWGWNHLSAGSSFAGNDVAFEETGYVLGLQLLTPLSTSTSLYFRAGGLFNHFEIENAEGNIISDSGHGLGWQLATGLEFSLGKNFSLNPGIKFSALSRETSFEGNTYSLDQNYFALRLGLVKKF